MNLRRAYELNSNSTGALRGLGLGEAFLGNPHQAIDCLTQALRISPRDLFTYQTHNTLAIACFGARDYEKSLHWASLAIRDAPNYPQAHLHFALACVGLADIEKAKSALDRTRRIAPEFVEARLRGYAPYRKPEDRQHFTVFLRIAAGLEEPGAAHNFPVRRARPHAARLAGIVLHSRRTMTLVSSAITRACALPQDCVIHVRSVLRRPWYPVDPTTSEETWFRQNGLGWQPQQDALPLAGKFGGLHHDLKVRRT